MKDPVRILGIDASLRSTGVGIIDILGTRLVPIMYQTIKAQTMPLSQALLQLSEKIIGIINEHKPSAAAIENIFFCRNIKTAITLGEARGAIIASCAKKGLPVYEYEPRKIKLAVAGFGTASKEQVQRMIKTLLNLKVSLGEDESDALAIAICHAHNIGQHANLITPKEI